jgi:hypothetical protein
MRNLVGQHPFHIVWCPFREPSVRRRPRRQARSNRRHALLNNPSRLTVRPRPASRAREARYRPLGFTRPDIADASDGLLTESSPAADPVADV